MVNVNLLKLKFWVFVILLKFWAQDFLCIIFQVLLQSDKVPANFSDRSLLKNLGHWLGLMTLAQNKPVLMRVSVWNI